MGPKEESPNRTSRSLSLTTGGLTLLGVLLSIGVTVGFGVTGPWWAGALAGLAVTALLMLAVKLGTSSGRGPLAQLAKWIIGELDARPGSRDA